MKVSRNVSVFFVHAKSVTEYVFFGAFSGVLQNISGFYGNTSVSYRASRISYYICIYSISGLIVGCAFICKCT